MSKVKEKQFWVSNISDRNVCLADLALTVPARRHMNLLDSKHFHYTETQLENSKESGSLFKKSHLIKVRVVAPEPGIAAGKHLSKLPRYLKYQLRAVEVDEPYFEELQPTPDDINVSEDQFADEITDFGNPFEIEQPMPEPED